ncbi:hypothetical protein F4561_005788 [Lipingzhangella halophila]|uniref:Uncharacterized protein n=1 Tax=Lipingzhangella halophila TaxID=1783352 RepID=A0A7W7RMV2_9ACTN|nr:hypothetical protein [Lipingzhangella halophila]MBB4934894.1 hypothetical protein [Lipingzhangella halophila]
MSTTYCEIREVADMAALRGWATAMGVHVQRHGTTLEGHDIFSATHGVTTLVCVVPADRAVLPPPVWRSPFERV